MELLEDTIEGDKESESREELACNCEGEREHNVCRSERSSEGAQRRKNSCNEDGRSEAYTIGELYTKLHANALRENRPEEDRIERVESQVYIIPSQVCVDVHIDRVPRTEITADQLDAHTAYGA